MAFGYWGKDDKGHKYGEGPGCKCKWNECCGDCCKHWNSSTCDKCNHQNDKKEAP